VVLDVAGSNPVTHPSYPQVSGLPPDHWTYCSAEISDSGGEAGACWAESPPRKREARRGILEAAGDAS
jgi:hypothetical protein